MAEEKCSTMEEELESKTRKLRRLMARYQQSKIDIAALRTEIQDTIHEFHQERADLLWSIKSLEQQHQLKNLIIEVSSSTLTGLRSQTGIWLCTLKFHGIWDAKSGGMSTVEAPDFANSMSNWNLVVYT
jgi:hypothetical protein